MAQVKFIATDLAKYNSLAVKDPQYSILYR